MDRVAKDPNKDILGGNMDIKARADHQAMLDCGDTRPAHVKIDMQDCILSFHGKDSFDQDKLDMEARPSPRASSDAAARLWVIYAVQQVPCA